MIRTGQQRFVFSWQGPTGKTCELVGDMKGWHAPVSMPEVEPGRYACTLTLEPGVYRYKFQVDGAIWHRDPSAPAVDDTESYQNGWFIVGGAPAPILFAPDRRHLVVYEDGRLVVHLEGEQGTSLTSLEVWGAQNPKEGEGPAGLRPLGRLPLHRVHARGDRVMFRAEATFDLAGPRPVALGLGGHTLYPIPAARERLAQPPAWARQAVFYAIFVDRWRRGVSSPPDPRLSARDQPSTAETFFGGDLDGVTESLDYLQSLGVDALILTPVHPSPSPHRYDGTDLLAVDPLLGGERAFAGLIEEAHRRGLRVIADLSITHVHESHPAFQSLLTEQQASPFASWFSVKRFPVSARDAQNVACYPRRPYLPALNLNDPSARAHALAAALGWVRRGVDGLRFDAMHDVPDEFWEDLRVRSRAENPDLLLMGEVISDRPGRYAEERGIDVATDFAHRELLLEFFFRGASTAAEFWERLTFHEFRTGPFDPCFRLLFLDNHDTERVLGPFTPYTRLRLALTYLLLRPEPVWLNYGTEQALKGPGRKVYDDAWNDRPPMPSLTGPATRTFELMRQLLKLRRELPELQGTRLVPLPTPGRLLGFDRLAPGGALRVLINASSEPAQLNGLVGHDLKPLLVVESEPSPQPGVLPPNAAHLYRVRF
jgi:cyclomaltodextrinase